MRGEYDHLRHLLLQTECDRLDELHASLRRTHARFEDVPDLLAEHLEKSLEQGRPSRLGEAMAEATTGSLETAVRRRPQAVVDAVYPIIGPAIRRSLGEAMREMADDLDRALRDTLGLRALRWRLQAWRSGMPYAQVVLRNTTHYQVEYLYLIDPESGLLLGHLAAKGLPALDSDAIAGMFTAIHQFVRDSVAMDGVSAGIDSATVGGYRLVVSDGPQARLVAFVRGLPSSDFRDRLDAVNEELHARHGSALSPDYAVGGSETGLLDPAELDVLNRSVAAPAAAGTGTRRAMYFVLAILAVAVLAYAALGIRWSMLSREIRARLSEVPGVVISQWDDSRRGRLRIEGLSDPAAADPRQWLAERYPNVASDVRMRPYLSLDPALIERRAAQRLGIPGHMVGYAGGVLRLKGRLPFADWYRAVRVPMDVPGVGRVDASALDYPNAGRVRELIKELQALRVQFDRGTAVPSPGMEPQLAVMLDRLGRLQRLGAAEGIAFHLRAKGYTDETGSYSQNRSLRQARAEWLAARLHPVLPSPSSVSIDPDVPSNATIRATSVVVTPHPVTP